MTPDSPDRSFVICYIVGSRFRPAVVQERRMAPLALIGSFGMQEMLVILLILVVLFGARRIPELARGLGEGIRGFRSSLRGDDEPPSNDKEAGDVSKTSNH